MGSGARRAFDNNCKDILALLKVARDKENHDNHSAEVVCKAAIVLTASFWEAYCEDIAAEGLAHLIDNTDDVNTLPKKLRQDLAAELKTDKNDLAIWALAEDGWRSTLRNRLDTYTSERNWLFNSPKPAQIDALFAKALGIPRISEKWAWKAKLSQRTHEPPTMTAAEARQMLTEYIEIRGAIAHRGITKLPVTIDQAQRFYEFIRRLASRTGGEVSRSVMKATGVPLWTLDD